MKKILLIGLIGFLSLNMATSQELWFDAGVKGAWGPSFLYNENLFNNPDYNQQISTAYTLGGKFGFNFGFIHGITLDAMYAQNKQDYNIKDGFSDVDNLDVTWNTLDLYLMYRLYRTINYLELGPKFSLMSRARNNGVDSKQFYVENYPSAVLGFGWYVFGRETFTATLGLRFEYGFQDIISSDGKDLGFPAYPVVNTTLEPYSATNPIHAQLVFELNWGIGYFAKTACAGRRHFFAF